MSTLRFLYLCRKALLTGTQYFSQWWGNSQKFFNATWDKVALMEILFLKNHRRKLVGFERKVSSRTLWLSCLSIPLLRFRAGPAASRGSQQEFQKCSSYRPYRWSCTGCLVPPVGLRRPIWSFPGEEKSGIFGGLGLEAVMMIEVEMAKARRILSLPQVVFEMRGLPVLFVSWQRLALHSS